MSWDEERANKLAMEQAFALKALAAAEQAYAKLPRKGKPQPNEWSVAAVFLASREDGSGLRVLAGATGNKCVGGAVARAASAGDVVLDGHAEVLARRALQKLLLEDAKRLQAGGDEQATLLGGADEAHTRMRLWEDAAALHLVVSTLPCGDAAVYRVASETKDEEEESEPHEPATKRPRTEDTPSTSSSSKVHATGARLLCRDAEAETEDSVRRVSVQDEEREHGGSVRVGVCRAKPGRGDPTHSMSCSDKIAMWGCAGLQGALLGLLLERPLVLATVVVCGGKDTSKETLTAMQESAERALVGRVSGCGAVPTRVVVLPRSFAGVAERNESLKSAGCGVLWHAAGYHDVVLTHMGKKLGTTKAKFSAPANCSGVAKRCLMAFYCDALPPKEQEAARARTYGELKAENKKYAAAKQRAKQTALVNWLPKIETSEAFHL